MKIRRSEMMKRSAFAAIITLAVAVSVFVFPLTATAYEGYEGYTYYSATAEEYAMSTITEYGESYYTTVDVPIETPTPTVTPTVTPVITNIPITQPIGGGGLFTSNSEIPSGDSNTPSGNPFTPSGQAAVLDHATDGDNKEFFTFVTSAGNVFFLVVDHQREGNNVYFLNAVTEQDLMALAEQSGMVIDTGLEGGIPVSTMPSIVDREKGEEREEGKDGKSGENNENNDNQESGGGFLAENGTIIFMLVVLCVAGVVGYYFKVVRPKKQAQGGDDYADEDVDEQDLGAEMQFETEVEDGDEVETDDDGL